MNGTVRIRIASAVPERSNSGPKTPVAIPRAVKAPPTATPSPTAKQRACAPA